MTDRILSERAVEAPVDCDRFDTLLPDYLEGDLAPAARAWADAHLARCGRCRTLADDLVAISRQAAALPPLQPERDLWAGIAARIEAPVVPLGRTGEQPALRVERGTTARPPRRADRFLQSKRWLAAAAGVLVAVSVGSTYTVMRLAGRTAATSVAAAPVAAPSTAPSTAPNSAPSTAPNTTPDVQQVASAAPAPADTTSGEAPRRTTPRAMHRADEGQRLARVADDGDVYAPAVRTYDREIAALRAALRQRSDLDSSTVAVLERNLKLIDEAIAQSRAALAHDPHSRVIGDQLTRALDLKVELLRTAVLLPSRS